MSVRIDAAGNALPDHVLHEVVDGDCVEKPTRAYSTWIANELFQSFARSRSTWSQGTFVLEMLFVLDRASNLRRRPSVAFVSHETWPLGLPFPNDKSWDVRPDLAIEVPCDRVSFITIAAKVAEYFRHGVDEVWIIVPETRQVYVHRSQHDARVLSAADVLSTPQIPGWSIAVGDLLPERSR